jgi:hypothetical protein
MFPVYDLPIPPVCTGHNPETQNTKLETEDPCTDDRPGLITRCCALRGILNWASYRHGCSREDAR